MKANGGYTQCGNTHNLSASGGNGNPSARGSAFLFMNTSVLLQVPRKSLEFALNRIKKDMRLLEEWNTDVGMI